MLLKNCRSKRSSNISVAECCQNKPNHEKVSLKKRIEMLLKKLPSETFVKNIRSRMLPKKYEEKMSRQTTVPNCCIKNCRSKRSSKLSVAECCRKKYRKSVAKSNSTRMLLKKLPFKTFVKNIRSRMLPKQVP